MSSERLDLRGKQTLVAGLGHFGGGEAAARWLAARGARVTVTDLRTAEQLASPVERLKDVEPELALGGHRRADFEHAELVVANPAMAPDDPLLEAARAAGAEITSEVSLFLEHCPARVFAVTGTQGKSSTCQLLASLLGEAGLRVHLGGNMGRPLLGREGDMEPEDAVVLELSSYQLETLDSPRAARVEAVGVTNVLADHLARHGSVEAYERAKRRVLDLLAPGGSALLPADDPRVSAWKVADARVLRFSTTPGVPAPLTIEGGAFRLAGRRLAELADLQLPGEFQRANALLALGLAWEAGADARTFPAGLRAARGLPHRLEDLGLRAGHRIWDNGVSTTPDSTLAALRSLQGPLTLVCGGQLKGLGLDELGAEAARRAERVVTFGAAARELAERMAAVGATVVVADSLEEGLREAFARMGPGEALLFSPACASFDAYQNFAERAAAFRAALPGPGPEDEAAASGAGPRARSVSWRST